MNYEYEQIDVEIDDNEIDKSEMPPNKFIKGLGLAIFSYIVLKVVFVPYYLIISALIEQLFSSDIPVLNWFPSYAFIESIVHLMSFVLGMYIIYYTFKWILKLLNVNNEKTIKTAVLLIIIHSTFSTLFGIVKLQTLNPTDTVLTVVFVIILYKLFHNTYTFKK